jgi:predicted DNA-binding transcriptional regulator YafY
VANTSSRILRLLSLLQTHRYWPGAELAERLGVSARTLRRDVDRLRELGYPVEAQRGVDGGYQLAAGTALPPLVLDDEEAVALAIGLRAAAQNAIDGIEDASLRALSKVQQVMPAKLRRRIDAVRAATVPAIWSGGPTISAAELTAVAQACRDEERLRFGYTAQSGDQTSRHVEPHRLVSLGRRWYLVAFDLHRHDWRTFRLDRLNGAQATGIRFQPRTLPAADAVEFVRASIGNLPTSHQVEVLFAAPATRVRQQVGHSATVDAIGDERCRLVMTTEHLDWAALTLGAVGAEFQVIRPPELVERVREWAARFGRATAAADAASADHL